MPRVKSNKPKRNVWKDPSPYGTYEGSVGTPDDWKAAFNFASYTREQALGILLNVIETPYVILGIAIDATQEQIKTAYRKLALINHPDKGGDVATFQKITAAYTVVSGAK